MNPILHLIEDVFSDGADMTLPPSPRMMFVTHGAVSIAEQSIGGGEAWHGEDEVTVTAGPEGATCWRFELSGSLIDHVVVAHGVASRVKLAAPLEFLPAGDLLFRGDSVAFPPGGTAMLHRHQGPGIRCLIEGGIRIDTHGRSTSYGPGGAWFESGPEPVFAQAAADRPSRFIRAMILPQSLLGKSSIQYVNEEDKAKPKSQSYKVFADMPITRHRGG
ncbi:hypothetical protein [Pseudorhodoplanes sp.]|uniref:hypothetical protein n=1 Tax=Pseudorhodoplanes sp. TaxID=1934341 RepID=UPI00391D8791